VIGCFWGRFYGDCSLGGLALCCDWPRRKGKRSVVGGALLRLVAQIKVGVRGWGGALL